MDKVVGRTIPQKGNTMSNVELAEIFLKEGLDGDCFCRNSKAVAIRNFAKWLDNAAQQSAPVDFACTLCKSNVHYYDGSGIAHCYFCEPLSR